MRPPWAVDELLFVERCTRCAECVRLCPEQILLRGAGGFPEMSFGKGGCTFCGACAESCDPGALALSVDPPIRWRVEIGDGCLAIRGVTCRACGDECEARAIRFRLRTGGRAEVSVAGDACNGCGACIRFCPVGAIHLEPGSQPREVA